VRTVRFIISIKFYDQSEQLVSVLYITTTAYNVQYVDGT